jgi:hypothetical protein
MALTYTFEINSVQKQSNEVVTDAVMVINYRKTGTDPETGRMGVWHGQQEFTMEQVDPTGFIAWENLTEQNLIDWVQANYEEAFVNAQIQGDIDTMISMESRTEVQWADLPWNDGVAPSEEEVAEGP